MEQDARADQAADAPAPRGPAAGLELVGKGMVFLGLPLLVLSLIWLAVEADERDSTIGTVLGPAVMDEISEPAPDFQLPLVSDPARSIRLSSARGDVVVLNFWGTWCAPCREETPTLQSAWTRWRSEGVRFLGVDVLDDESAARAFQEEFGVTYPSGSDPSASLADDFGYVGLPATYVIDEQGVMRFRFIGAVSGADIDRAVRALLEPAEDP
jgi:cytochrome c biogenesis protein CcmG/thiol:disulfide interchange protein DsbE